ncbi:hypothetical protein MHL31_05680 [Lutibacter sp. A80]|uniref:hypothetical protein n=1 Tax=Lutibacter sp. A80 TaxID=2918453 RepID=UPI001F067A8D|nr:hypothetical protein [Lutibacter sp. A80]UMB61693.1 hypothetical protein MHL31_05680 [Lutibacter sp. A80]
MKNIRIISFFISLLILVSCEEEEYVDYTPVDELSDVSWIISLQKFTQNPFNIEEDSFMSFFDLSVGASSHQWIIEDGNAFLNEGFKKGDSLPLFINSEAGLTTTDVKAHVIFRKSGVNKVRLLNKFPEPVSYKSSAGTLNSKKEGDFWVIDTTFTFDVFANLKPAFKVLQNNVEVLSITEDQLTSIENEASWPTVEVEAGATLTFIDQTTTGRANGRNWAIPSGIPASSNLDTVTVKFFKLGTYNAGVFKALRATPYPTASVEKTIPLKINVIPSSQPFKINGAIKEDVNEKISFQVTGEIVPFTDQEDKFVVHVKNTAAGFDQTIPVLKASVNSTDATYIDLTLSEKIYNSDVVTVAYNGGEIESTDTRQLASFPATNVQMYIGGNILKSNSWSGYEIGLDGDLARAFSGPNGAFWVGAPLNGSADNPIWSRTTEKAYEGNASMKFNVDGITKAYQLHTFGLGTIDMIPAGTYKISFMVYLEAGNTMEKFWTWGGEVPELAPEAWNLDGLPREQWIKIEHIVTLSEINSKKKVTLVINPPSNPNSSTGQQTMYFDNFSFVEVEVRS